MQAIARRLAHQSLKPSTSLKSIYPISDRYYGADHERCVSTLSTKGVGHLVRKGTGGRSSVSGIVATVFGATGFLGRYVVQQLAKMGSQVLVPFRGSEDCHRHLKLMGDLGQIVPMKYNPRDENSVKAVMAKANVVINLIGRDYETRNYSFEEVHYHMAEQLAKISKEHGGIMRFIQVSCLGASPSSASRMLRAKAAAEEAILRELPEATILKPAIMIGTEDRILNPWAHFAKKYSFLPLIGDGSTKIQPVYVVDVAAALTAVLKDDGTSMGKTYELGGPEIFTVHELAELMYETIREWPRLVKVPFSIAKALATPREILLNKVPFPLPTPEILNLDQINALTTDTVVSENALTFDDLGIVPHKLKGYPIEFLISYRKGGPQFGSTISERVSPEDWP
ncbi:NADH dehydrogenase [ubiquinone] 1 alpha subcomplex subunit 9, mitochondrial isoform X2 [Abrus precatorius]|uniref:NADH dehydrogenase [ubiquinone] 1 alpha subcomplex subunit 9, mitochondrial isoform X2 n=1 Tax=Abrus precatorius TaxID=3816 RepID=A0A8B8M948_ABRPR|nr:NADH dehydrogenase [ubiquinone] 1 alpha subcomplex subunit 9, mitochondrial isoform X2 [Abrus precatorius]